MKFPFFALILLGFSVKAQVDLPYVPSLLQSSFNGSQEEYFANPVLTTILETEILAETEMTSATAIRFSSGFRAHNFQNNGHFRASIVPAPFEVKIMEPRSIQLGVGKFEKLELGIKLPQTIQSQIDQFLNNGSGINPYDPDQIKFEVDLASPTLRQFKKYGFYFRNYQRNSANTDWIEVSTQYPWRFRFAPDEVGTWACKITVKVYGQSDLVLDRIYFNCINNNKPGYLVKGQFNRTLKFSENNLPFFGIGENISNPTDPLALFNVNQAPSDFDNQLNKINELADAGGNYVRMMLIPEGHYIERTLGNYHESQYSLWELDKVFQLAENRSIMLQVAFDSYVYYLPYYVYNQKGWTQNSYNSLNQGKIYGIDNPIDFFTNPIAKDYYKKRLFYFVARYGYSSNIAVFELFNEIDNVGKVAADSPYPFVQYDSFRYNVNFWQNEMMLYIKSLDSKHLITTSYAGLPSILGRHGQSIDEDIFNSPIVDLISLHRYNNLRNMNLADRYAIMKDEREQHENKPIQIGELGLSEFCNDVTFHNDIWANAFFGGFTTGLNWYHDKNHAMNSHSNFTGLRSFLNEVDWENIEFTPSRYPFEDLNEQTTVEAAFLTNESSTADEGNLAIGWVHNRSYYWGNLPSCTSMSQFIVPDDDDTPSSPITYSGFSQEFEIRNMEINKEFKVKWYDTRTGNLLLTTFETSSLIGRLLVSVPELDATHPDYGFKIEKVASNIWRIGNNGTTTTLNEDSISAFVKYSDVKIDPKELVQNNTMENGKNFTSPTSIQIDVHPNPSSDFIIITSLNSINLVKIFNVTGEIVSEIDRVSLRELRVDVSRLASGVYFIDVYLENNIRKKFKIIVN